MSSTRSDRRRGPPAGVRILGILRALEELGPMTATEIAAYLDVPRSNVSSPIARLSREMKERPQRVHIESWRHDAEGQRDYARAVYAPGPGKNAPKPKAITNAARKAREREVAKAIVRNSSVFNLGLQ